MCYNDRRISLISTASKLLASVVVCRLSPFRELQCRAQQARFRPGRERDGQMTWKSSKIFIPSLADAQPSRPPDWYRNDTGNRWLETLAEMG